MKELSIEEKAERYDKSFERASNIHKDAVEIENSMLTKTCEVIFPELVEVENERIRKALIDYFNDADKADENPLQSYGVHTDKVIAWIEKQDNINETINRDKFAQDVLIGAAINLITWIDYNSAEGNMCLSNMECKDIEDALVHADWDKIYAYLKKKLEKQDEKLQDKSALEAIKEEKVYNTNKVKPKFKVGDWIVHHGTENIYQVVAIIDNQYQLKYGDTYTVQKCANVDMCSRLWNIAKDAKEGDVLVSCSNQPFIYNGKFIETSVGAYCGLNVCGVFIIGKLEECDWTCNKNIKPATKEQHDLLFTKMKEEGYKFDKDFNLIKI